MIKNAIDGKNIVFHYRHVNPFLLVALLLRRLRAPGIFILFLELCPGMTRIVTLTGKGGVGTITFVQEETACV